MREPTLSLERKNAEARKPLAQFPGFDGDELFRSSERRQAGTVGAHSSLGSTGAAFLWNSANVDPALDPRAFRPKLDEMGRAPPCAARRARISPSLECASVQGFNFSHFWEKCARAQRGVGARPSPKKRPHADPSARRRGPAVPG